MGVNFRDVLNVLGMYPGDPGAPGSDCSGVVVAGPGAGRAVFGLAVGCLGSHVVAPEEVMVDLPPHISYEEAASTPTICVTVSMMDGCSGMRGSSWLMTGGCNSMLGGS